MSNLPVPEGSHEVQSAPDAEITREIPFSLIWLRAVDPRIFTPLTLEYGGESTIRMRAADGTIRVNVYRHVGRYDDIEIKDEVYALRPGEGEAGPQDLSIFRYNFGSDGVLTNYDPNPRITGHMQEIVPSLGGLVRICSSTIEATSYTRGPESSFVSDCTKWIEKRSGIAAPEYPDITAGRLAIGPPATE